MSAHTWSKLPDGLIYDPEFMMLSDRFKALVIETAILAANEGNEGPLPDVRQMAFALHRDMEELETDLHALADLHALSLRDGVWFHEWYAKWQAPAESTERVRRWRERQKKQAVSVPEARNDVTVTETLRGTNREGDSERAAVAALSERATLEEQFGIEQVAAALRYADRNGAAHPVEYAAKVLRSGKHFKVNSEASEDKDPEHWTTFTTREPPILPPPSEPSQLGIDRMRDVHAQMWFLTDEERSGLTGTTPDEVLAECKALEKARRPTGIVPPAVA